MGNRNAPLSPRPGSRHAPVDEAIREAVGRHKTRCDEN
jgi:hypothetical protein